MRNGVYWTFCVSVCHVLRRINGSYLLKEMFMECNGFCWNFCYNICYKISLKYEYLWFFVLNCNKNSLGSFCCLNLLLLHIVTVTTGTISVMKWASVFYVDTSLCAVLRAISSELLPLCNLLYPASALERWSSLCDLFTWYSQNHVKFFS